MSQYILFEEHNGVAKIILNRPDKFNSFVREMALSFQEKLDYCAQNKSIRTIYISANGKAFCAGQDLAEAIDDNGIELQKIVSEHYNPIIKKIRQLEKPVVCAVNGVAAGAGANIALACDIVVAAKSASFIQAFSKIGLIPDSGGTYFLPRIIGLQKAAALMMLGDKVSADEAEKMGMIYKVFEDDLLESEALKLSETLASMPTRGLGLTKKLLNVSFNNNLEQQLQREDDIQTEAGNTYDYTEGVRAFLEKRKPHFKGE
jgi:2-(1,2-epoxy-1,2-dihydrophenyl)acetyl-CoA isomerase